MSVLKQCAKKVVYSIPSSLVLMFHHVSMEPEIEKSGCKIETEKFKQVIDAVPRFGSLQDVIQHPGRKRAAITFDDGLEDVYTIAYPYLKAKGVPFTIFVITDFLDTPGYISTEQLKELAGDPLVTIGSHGISHEVFTQMQTKQKSEELQQSKDRLQELTGREIDIFAFSHGQYDSETIQLMKMYRYGMAVTPRPLNVFTKYNLKTLPRYNVESATADHIMNVLSKVVGK